MKPDSEVDFFGVLVKLQNDKSRSIEVVNKKKLGMLFVLPNDCDFDNSSSKKKMKRFSQFLLNDYLGHAI